MSSSTIYHARSISLPSRPHEVAEQLDEQLSRLRSSQSTSTSSASVSEALNGLTDLYSCVDDFLQLPLNQHVKCVDEVLDGSVRLLDICSASRDALQQSRERLQDLQSALRRRYSGELTITSEVVEYLNTRRTIKKAIKKCLKNLKPETEQKDGDLLNDVQAITADTFKTLLTFIAGSQKNSWSVVAKFINKETTTSTSEFDVVDATLNSLMVCKKKSNIINLSQMEDLRCQISTLETEIQDIDEALECLFRHLVKTRATLLNIFSY